MVKATPYLVAICFGEQVGDRHQPQHQRGHEQADGELAPAEVQIERKFVFLIVTLEAQHHHAQALEEEAPHHAERVRLGQNGHVAAAADDGGDLQNRDQVDDAVGGAELALRLAEPRQQNAVFGHAVQHAVGADDGGVHALRPESARPRSPQKCGSPAAAGTDRSGSSPGRRSGCRSTSDRIVVRNDHAGEHGDHAGADHGVPAHHVGGDPQILQLGIGDFAVDLRQRLKSAHRQQRMAERDDDRHHRESAARTCP